MKRGKIYKHNDVLYSDSKSLNFPSTFDLYLELESEGLATSMLDYGRSDYLAEYYYLSEDYENGIADYQIEDWVKFIERFADKLGVTILGG